MLYYLFRFLEENFNLPGAGLFSYVSFRAGMALIFSLFISMVIGKNIINYLRKKQIGESIRDLGLDGQMSKKGTPTMGGIIIIIAILVPSLLFGRIRNIYLLLMIATTVWLGVIGFLDDYIKVFRKHKEGLNGKFKIVGQIGIGLLVGMTMFLSPEVVMIENTNHVKVQHIETTEFDSKSIAVKSTQTTIPFIKNTNFDYADFLPFLKEHAQTGAWILFIIITIFIVTAVSNGANLTDGLDGLAAGSSSIIGITLGVLAYVSSHVGFAGYFDIMFVPGSEELVVFASAFVGATVGFLWYNSYPAQVFMGDTGSLAIGGIIAVAAVMIKKELLIPILCGIFFVESISVIVQRLYFKYTRIKYGEGVRIFRMAPLHHHFQKEGVPALIQRPRRALPEAKIVARFWIIAIILAVLSIVTLKIR